MRHARFHVIVSAALGLLWAGCSEDGYLIRATAADAGLARDAPGGTEAGDVIEADAVATLLCANGLTCADPGTGMLACLDDGSLPPGTIFGCELGTCPSNFRCRFTDESQTQAACYENCGVCPAPTTCVDVTGTGQLGCMNEGMVPAGAIRGCVQTAGCPGNATCYLLGDAGNESVCIENCSACAPGTCPPGQTCIDGVCG